MDEWFRDELDRLGRVSPAWAYVLLLVSALLENLIPPIPGDTVVVFGAYLVGRGLLGIWPVYAATCCGGLVGFMGMYYVGRTRGRAFLSGRAGRLLSPQGLARAEQWLERYGAALILANRFLSGVRSVIALAAGIGAMGWRKVAVCGAVSLLAWNGLLLYAGLLLGERWEELVHFLGRYGWGVWVALALVLLLLLASRRWRRRKPNGGLTVH
ncbi:MAG: DedA family protein [Candidatus Latescibacterota bacterium]